MSWSLERKVAAGFSAGLVILLLVGGLAARDAARVSSTFRWVDHTHQVLYALEKTLIDALSMQTGSRGYAVSGADQHLAVYEAGRTDLSASLARLHDLVANNPVQQARVSELAGLLDRHIALMERRNAARRLEAFQPGAFAASFEEGLVLMTEIRALVAQMEGTERELLATRSARSQSAARATLLVVGGASLIAILIVTLAGLLVQRDLRLRRAAEAALQKSRSTFLKLFENAADGFVVADSRGKIVRVNKQAEQLFGYSRGELVGQPVELLLPQHLRGAHEAHRRRFQAAPQTRVMGAGLELLGRHRNGSEFPVDIMLSPMQTDEGDLVMATVRDITARQAAEQKISRLNAELLLQNSQLEAANQELEAFSYSVSHDLRAPLRHIDGFASLLREDAAKHLDGRSRRHLTVISEAARQMGRLIDDLLLFSRMSRSELQVCDVDQNGLVARIVQEARFETDSAKVTWAIESLPVVQADPALLRQAWFNLIDNAVKYSSKESHARVEIGCTTDENGQPVSYIRDNGVGFDMKYADKLFGIFQRLHTTEEFTGTGIGLANVRRILTRHGGRIWAESELGAGATFYFWLPLPAHRASAGAEPCESLDEPAQARR